MHNPKRRRIKTPRGISQLCRAARAKREGATRGSSRLARQRPIKLSMTAARANPFVCKRSALRHHMSNQVRPQTTNGLQMTAWHCDAAANCIRRAHAARGSASALASKCAQQFAIAQSNMSGAAGTVGQALHVDLCAGQLAPSLRPLLEPWLGAVRGYGFRAAAPHPNDQTNTQTKTRHKKQAHKRTQQKN